MQIAFHVLQHRKALPNQTSISKSLINSKMPALFQGAGRKAAKKSVVNSKL
jgi:hypothetical protein